MRKKGCVLLGLVLILANFVGCREYIEEPVQNKAEKIMEENIKYVDETEELTVVETNLEETIEQSEEPEHTKDEINEYAIYVGDSYYPLDDNYIFDEILEDGESKEFLEDFPYPAGTIHYGDGLEISTFFVDDKRGKGEVIFNIVATKDAKTPRGVCIGDTLSDLQTAYSELKYEENWMPEDHEPLFNRVYIYAPEDNEKYIAFFLYEKEIVMISVEEGFDYMPGEEIDRGNILGVKGVQREINNMSSKGANISYFYTNDAGEETIILELYARSVYEVDIDDDGITELVVYLPMKGDWQSIGIYDVVNGEISYIDINEKMGSVWSFGLENCINIKPEYERCINIGFENEDGTQRSEIYRVVDNELIYVCKYSDEVLR